MTFTFLLHPLAKRPRFRSMGYFDGSPTRAGAWALAASSALTMATSLQCAAAQTLPAVQACHVNVYARDPDPKGLNIRKGPGSEHAVVAQIRDDDARFEVTGASGKWLRIRQAAGPDGTVYFKSEGWVYAPLTAVRAIKARGLGVSPAGGSGASIGKIAADEEAAVQSCEGEWVQVQTPKTTGWLPPGNHCGNPVTGCV